MDITISVHEYVVSQGIRLSWEPGSRMETHSLAGEVIIKANRAGLILLANHLLTLAQENDPAGDHLHFDDSNALEQGSCSLIVALR
jgi:hypothetical protein